MSDRESDNNSQNEETEPITTERQGRPISPIGPIQSYRVSRDSVVTRKLRLVINKIVPTSILTSLSQSISVSQSAS